MRAEEYLTERASSVLFHYTNLSAAVKILSSGVFKLSSSFAARAEEKYAPKGYPFYLSASRTKTGDYHLRVNQQGVLFVLDGNWFSNRYPVKPVDYWEGSWVNTSRGSESEDRIFSKTSTIPIQGIQTVHVLLSRQDNDYAPHVRQILMMCKQRSLPVYLYTDAQAWRLQNIRKSIPISQAIKSGLIKGTATSYPQQYRKDKDIKPWIELLMKKDPETLSPEAWRVIKDITSYYSNSGNDFGLTGSIIGQRYPGGSEYNLANKLVAYLIKNNLTILDFVQKLRAKWQQIEDLEVVDEGQWEVDQSYTEQDIQDLHRVAMVVENYARSKLGVTVRFSKHYFDQAVKKRGAGKIVPQLMLDASAKLLKRGLNYFRDKPDMTSYAFQDNINGIIFEVLKHSDNKFEVRTVVRDTRWLGRSQKIVYED